MKLFQIAALSTLALGLATTAQAVIIDNFDGPFQEVFATSGSSTSVGTPGSDSGVPEIWGFREFRIEITQTNEPAESFSDNLNGNSGGIDTFQFSTDGGVVADHQIRWFGGSLASGVDVTENGVHDAFELSYLSSDGGIDTEITLTDTSGNTRTQVLVLPPYVDILAEGPRFIYFDFDFYRSAGTNLVDLTEIQEIVLRFDTNAPATDAEFGFLRTVDNVSIVVPVPGSALLLLAGLGGALRMRKRSK